MKGGDIWNGYIDFEMTNNHLGFVNLLCYMAVKTPLLMATELEQKYYALSKLSIQVPWNLGFFVR